MVTTNTYRKDYVMITIKKTTHALLKSYRLVPRETFDQVINRLIIEVEEQGEDNTNSPSPQLISTKEEN